MKENSLPSRWLRGRSNGTKTVKAEYEKESIEGRRPINCVPYQMRDGRIRFGDAGVTTHSIISYYDIAVRLAQADLMNDLLRMVSPKLRVPQKAIRKNAKLARATSARHGHPRRSCRHARSRTIPLASQQARRPPTEDSRLVQLAARRRGPPKPARSGKVRLVRRDGRQDSQGPRRDVPDEGRVVDRETRALGMLRHDDAELRMRCSANPARSTRWTAFTFLPAAGLGGAQVNETAVVAATARLD